MKKHVQANTTKEIMAQIKGGQLHMRSRWYFVALAVLSIGAALSSALIISYIMSLLWFWMRIQTANTMAWGARANLNAAMSSFPWWLAVLAVILFAFTVWLVKRQGRMYRHKTSSIVAIMFAITLLIGFGLSYLDIGDAHKPEDRRNTAEQRGPGRQRNIQN